MTPVAAFITNILFLMLQSFVLTFLAEWGDRSQIATIAVRHDLVIVHFMFCEDFCNWDEFFTIVDFIPVRADIRFSNYGEPRCL